MAVMTTMESRDSSEEQDRDAAVAAFEGELGVSGLKTKLVRAGTEIFLKFLVGKPAPIFDHALRQANKKLPESNSFHGLLRVEEIRSDDFPSSLEASCLLTLLARATRPVAQGNRPGGFAVPPVPFQNREDHKLTQTATQLIVGRRGVGKSTLIMRATDILRASKNIVVVLDMQAYSELTGDPLAREVFVDLTRALRDALPPEATPQSKKAEISELEKLTTSLAEGSQPIARTPVALRRILGSLARKDGTGVYVFLDDYHLVDRAQQPLLLQLLHGALKGANGWLKVAGVHTLLNYYDPLERKGLQVPGDAQLISLDLTLENTQAAENHLRAILDAFLHAVGYSSQSAALPEAAFRRLVWSNAGVPRDFLQMFARSLEQARRNQHVRVTLSDVNVSIGESGQQKIDEMLQDARNEEGVLRRTIEFLDEFCFGRKSKVNAFLVRADQTRERQLIQTLSDLRLVHLIHQSITPNRAGKRYAAFIVDYSLFTGFRRRRGVQEMLPEAGKQFSASELRKLPKLPEKFLSSGRSDEPKKGSVAPRRPPQ